MLQISEWIACLDKSLSKKEGHKRNETLCVDWLHERGRTSPGTSSCGNA